MAEITGFLLKRCCLTQALSCKFNTTNSLLFIQSNTAVSGHFHTRNYRPNNTIQSISPFKVYIWDWLWEKLCVKECESSYSVLGDMNFSTKCFESPTAKSPPTSIYTQYKSFDHTIYCLGQYVQPQPTHTEQHQHWARALLHTQKASLASIQTRTLITKISH